MSNTNPNNNAPIITPSEVTLAAEIAFNSGNFLYLEGPGGGGKTSIACNDLPRALNRELWYANLNGSAPTECLGYGQPQENGDMTFYAPEQWPTADRVGDKPVLLVIDEFNDYEKEVKALLRSLYPAQGKPRVGTHVLGDDVKVVVLGNRRSDGTSSRVEEAPFTSRCSKYTLLPSVADWMAWADTNEAVRNSNSHVPTFLKFSNDFGGDVDHFCPPVQMPYTGAPHPTPRQWASIALAEKFRLSNPDAYRRHVRACVGEKAALAYEGFLQHVDALPAVEEIKKNPDGFKLSDDPVEQFAAVSCCLATVAHGVDNYGVAVAEGKFDWLVTLLLRCRGDIREFGARACVRKGIPLDQHSKATELITL